MAHESPDASTLKPPLWLPPVASELERMRVRGMSSAATAQIMDVLCYRLALNGDLRNFDDLQYYLKATDAPVSLLAHKFDQKRYPDISCLDMKYRRPRGYCFSVQPVEIARLALGDVKMSDEVNTTILTRNTGILVPKSADPYAR